MTERPRVVRRRITTPETEAPPYDAPADRPEPATQPSDLVQAPPAPRPATVPGAPTPVAPPPVRIPIAPVPQQAPAPRAPAPKITAPAPTPTAPAPVSAPAPATLAPLKPAPSKATSKLPPANAEKLTPPERLAKPGDLWRLSDLASACGDESLAAHNRLDPYWDGLWQGGASASWLTRGVAQAQSNAGLLPIPAQMLTDRKIALGKLSEYASTSKFTMASRMCFLGILHGWRTCTAEQLATIAGNKALASPSGHVASMAFASGLVDFALPQLTARSKYEPFGKETIYRPARPDVFDHLSDNITWAEWIAVTGGQPWISGGHYDRHNILATELGLRLAEYADIGTVLGERFSSVDLLTGSGVGRPEVIGDQRAADLSVIREDGMVIAVEITATISPNFDRKVERWVELLASSPIEATGLTVLFLVAQPLDSADAPRYRTKTYQAVAKAIRNNPGMSIDPTKLRIGVASWREWFPDRHTVSDAFLSMRAHRPTGPDGWSDADFLDPDSVPFHPTDPNAMTAVIDNAALLGQTPHWLRNPHRAPSVVRELLHANGLSELPPVATVRCDTPMITDVRRSHGVATADAAPPRRLLGLGVS